MSVPYRSPIPALDPDPQRETPNEWTTVERPLLQQLAAMGWEYLKGDMDYPQKTLRENFREVLLREPLRNAIRKINAAENLDDITMDRAIRELERSDKPGGMDRNRELTEKLIKGVSVPRATGGESPHSRNVTVRFIDFDPAEQDNNSFLAINQFRIDTIGRVGFVIPDVILFVNGIPLVIIECKSPSLAETDDGGFWKPVESGITQLLRYSNQREEVELEEGVEHLFHWNQLMVSSCYYAARVATFGADYKHYVEWKDTAPFTEAEVLAEIGRPGKRLRSQEKLVAGMLRPAHLLDILRHFILFQVEEGRLTKLCPRYQQYRAVQKAMVRLAEGKTRERSEKRRDERGGIIWHTQGSGKSITMVQLVRKLRTTPGLCGFKVVVVTDRTSLEQQLQETAKLTGERVRPDKDDFRSGESGSDRVKRILSEDGPDLVFCMVQKNQDREGEVVVLEYEVPVPPPRKAPCGDVVDYQVADGFDVPKAAEAESRFKLAQGRTKTLRQVIRNETEYPEVNPSEKILLLIDECHRSHTLSLHANLMRALPNAAKIGFTGTPIMNRDRGNTLNIFDDFIDKYSMKQAEEDEATVKILYEGRVPLGLVENGARLDAQVPVRFSEFTEPEQQIIMQKFTTERKVMEASKLIAVKARDMLHHYVRNILPGNCKAQVVAVSQEAVVLYQKALCAARDELVQAAEAIDPVLRALSEEELLQRSEDERSLVAAYKELERVKALEFAAVISKRHNQSADWDRWTDPNTIETHIADFKKPFEHKDKDKRSNLGILCVMRMLLTGFDAPVEQAIYLDRRMIEHDLLQAIARVNRKRLGKECGYVIDYIGIARELRAALTESEEGGEGGPRPPTGIDGVRDEIPRLRDRHQKALDVFRTRGILELMPIDPCVDLLENEKIRAEFLNRVRAFLASLAIVMPRPEALPFVRDAKILGFIAKVAANLYRDNQLNLEGVDRRMKRLIDEYVSAQGIDPRIAPVPITDIHFLDEVKRKKNARARASEMKHALRHQIRLRYDEDPAHYKKLSERLEAIIQQLKDNWEALEEALRKFIRDELEREGKQTVPGLDPRLHAPFFGTLKEAIEKTQGQELKSDDPVFKEVVDLTVATVDEIREKIRLVDFWRDEHSRRSLEKSVYRSLLRSGKIARDKIAELATRVVDQARNLHRLLVWGNGKNRD
ncbi:type I restriction endonuclease subunit R [Desulfatiglans anilini]|uniref:type I restriction endonuclease subunit R n=1 Tax=Desulfatiglans anilini TaxID=90728 RepID=UPI00068429BB|nr:type I restriction endonuclease [Desulfatiglans anilini]